MTGVGDEFEVWLFSYGTLRQPDVQRRVFGREVRGREDELPGYRLSLVEIADPAAVATSGAERHPIAKATGQANDTVAGCALRVTPDELARADGYETADYRRVSVRLASGLDAFVYVEAAD